MSHDGRNIEIEINSTRIAGVVLPELISYTFDWWLNSDDHAGWDFRTSILTVNLTSSRLIGAATGLAPAFLRIGGSRADRIVYHFEPSDDEERKKCEHQSNSCLTMARWDDILAFAFKVKARVVFTLNYLGYTEHDTVDWDVVPIYRFLNYTASRHSQSGTVYGFELGNEPLHSGKKVQNMERYAKSHEILRNMIDTLWMHAPNSKPKLMGPATTGAGETFSKALGAIGSFLDVATYHKYRLGDGESTNLAEKAIDPSSFKRSTGFDDASFKTSNFLPSSAAQVWIGEGAMAYHSGQDGVTNTFSSSFWYANQLGEIATSKPFAHSVFCRQTLTGGNYELLAHEENYEPNPDYWTARLWNILMGTVALDVQGIDCCIPGSDTLLLHAFCARPSALAKEGDVSILFINIDKNNYFNASISFAGINEDSNNLHLDDLSRSDFVLEAHTASRLKSKKVRLNGDLLQLGNDGELPFFQPQKKMQRDPILVPPLSLLFSVLHNVSAPACFSSFGALS